MPWVDPHNYEHPDRVDVFISAKQPDDRKVQLVAEKLHRENLLVFHTGLEMPPGMNWDALIQRYLRISKSILVCWSKGSVESRWVNSEAEYGLEHGLLVSCKVEKCELLPPFNTFQTLDLSDWEGEDEDPRWQQLVKLLKHRSSGKVSAFSQFPTGK